MFKKFWDTILFYLKTDEIRNKIYFSLIILLMFRVLASLPVVGIKQEDFINLFNGSSFGDLLSTLSGGVLQTASIVAIGLNPYINASVTLQLLTPVIPKLEELRKEGSQGRRLISMYTRLLTVPLAILQSFAIYSILRGQGFIGALDTVPFIVMCATLTGGAILMMWFGELISESGIGGGTSFLIFLGILSGLPGNFIDNWRYMDILQKVLLVLMNLIIVAVVIMISESERRVKVQYSRRVRAGGSLDSYIPLKLTQSGVMPVIFAISLLSFPQLIAQFLISRNINSTVTSISQTLITWISNPYTQNIGLFVLVIAFSLFYVTVVFNTEEISENLQKNGGFVPGIRPGKATASYLRGISLRLTVVGALVLAILAVLPNLLEYIGFLQKPLISGTGFLILVGVVLDMRRQIKSMAVVKDYGKYI
ncbi:MAG TPA: preprotein translocase subunit SecY [Candidatus Dojkabacteria bacterium]|nr:preprotein translocase subunit SecY [Candidatus Dojkabacteria bacterium]